MARADAAWPRPIAPVTRLEVGFSARSGTELRAAVRRPPLSAMPVEYLTPAMEDRAAEVQGLLGDQGHHRAPSVPGLLIAAVAELTWAVVVVLHVDEDLDLIASITGQPVERAHSLREPRLRWAGTQPPRGLKPAGSSRRCALMKPVSASTSRVGPSPTIWPWSSTSDRGHSSSA